MRNTSWRELLTLYSLGTVLGLLCMVTFLAIGKAPLIDAGVLVLLAASTFFLSVQERRGEYRDRERRHREEARRRAVLLQGGWHREKGVRVAGWRPS